MSSISDYISEKKAACEAAGKDPKADRTLRFYSKVLDLGYGTFDSLEI